MEIVSKREQNRLQRRGVIVETATRAFLDQGYAATSMSAIADELGGSKATLWSHFGSKEELFTAVIDQLVVQFSSALEETLSDDHFTIEGLRRYCRRFLARLMQDDAIRLFRLIVSDGARFPEIIAVFHVRAPARLHRMVAAYFGTRFTEDVSDRLARITNNTMVGYRSHALTRPVWPSPIEMEQFVDDFIAHLKLPGYDMGDDGDPYEGHIDTR